MTEPERAPPTPPAWAGSISLLQWHCSKEGPSKLSATQDELRLIEGGTSWHAALQRIFRDRQADLHIYADGEVHEIFKYGEIEADKEGEETQLGERQA